MPRPYKWPGAFGRIAAGVCVACISGRGHLGGPRARHASPLQMAGGIWSDCCRGVRCLYQRPGAFGRTAGEACLAPTNGRGHLVGLLPGYALPVPAAGGLWADRGRGMPRPYKWPGAFGRIAGGVCVACTCGRRHLGGPREVCVACTCGRRHLGGPRARHASPLQMAGGVWADCWRGMRCLYLRPGAFGRTAGEACLAPTNGRGPLGGLLPGCALPVGARHASPEKKRGVCSNYGPCMFFVYLHSHND